MKRRLDWMLKEVRFNSDSVIQLLNCVNLSKSRTLFVLCSKLFFEDQKCKADVLNQKWCFVENIFVFVKMDKKSR